MPQEATESNKIEPIKWAQLESQSIAADATDFKALHVRTGHQPQDRQGARPRSPATLLARADEVIE